MKLYRLVFALPFLAAVACGISQNKSVDDDGVATSEIWRKTETGMIVNDGGINLFDVPNLPIYPTLIGGAPADRKDWPASFTTSQGNSRCTGTLLGSRVLQLAAHCVGNGKTASITSEGTKYTATCSHHPRYKNDATSDYALCVFSTDVAVAWYESVLASGDEIKVGSSILLAGMGCTQPGGGGGSNDVLRIGEAPVKRLPTNDNDLITEGSAALCFGDSGGSAFFKGSDGVYKVAAINSRGNIQDTSYLSAVYTESARQFYVDWSVKNNVKICGVAIDAENCRGGAQPDPTPVPPWCADTLATVNKCIYGNPRQSLSDVEGCRKAYTSLYACQLASERQE
jgi:hypothetical protein